MTYRRQKRLDYRLIGFAGLLVLAGCQGAPAPVAGESEASAVTFETSVPPALASSAFVSSADGVVSHSTQVLTAQDLPAVLQDPDQSGYRLGPNDIIVVTVYRHPELSVPSPDAAANMQGALITSDGMITMPLIGAIQIGGMTPDQAQLALEAAFGKYLRQPSVNVQLVRAESLRYYLLGSFTQPGIKYPEHELNLLDALSLGGSVDLQHADLYQAYVTQGSTKLPVDLNALLIGGDMTQNIQLASGDAIVIPSSETENGFVFGAVSKPGVVPFQAGRLSLLQALSAAGLDLPTYSDAGLSQVRIIRPHGNAAEFFVVDVRSMLHGTAGTFALVPGDIVFVPPTALASWNQVVEQLLPSLQTVGAALNPFVSIKYLDSH